MTQENYRLVELDSLLSKDKITQDDPLQLPELFREKPKNTPTKTLLCHEPENLFVAPTEKPTIALNDRAKKRKSIIPSRQPFWRQRKREEATFEYSFS